MMNELFYWLGFFWLGITIYEFIELFRNHEENEVHFAEYSDAIDKAKKIKPHRIILSILYFIWLVVGYKFDMPEKIWFLVSVIVSTTNFIVPAIIGGVWGFIAVKQEIQTGEKKKLNIDFSKLNVVTGIAHIIMLTYILVHHFFL